MIQIDWVQAGAPTDEVDADGASVLHHAAEGGNIHILDWLLQDASCDPSCKTTAGCTILHYAARSAFLIISAVLKCMNLRSYCIFHA